MYEKQESIFYYLTVGNENYAMPPMPEEKNIKEGILKGIYRFTASKKKDAKLRVHLLGSGAILNEVIKAEKTLEEKYDVAVDVWSVTSYVELHRDALSAERYNMLNPTQKQKTPYLTEVLGKEKGIFIAASDYIKALPDSIARWLPGPLISLGTDGFGRSEGRKSLRDFFEVDERYIVVAALTGLMREGKIKPEVIQKAIKDFDINPEKLNPMIS